MKNEYTLYEELKDMDYIGDYDTKEEDLQFLRDLIQKYGYEAAQERAARILL